MTIDDHQPSTRRAVATNRHLVVTVRDVTDPDIKMTPEQWQEVNTALFAYWTAREDAKLAQEAKGSPDVGGRAGVTAGNHLNRVAQMLARVCRTAGAPRTQIYYNAPADDPERLTRRAVGYTLPGFYRPTKQWDVVVYHDDNPIVIIELKSQNGPSYGNNANNRAEEAIGNAVDLQRARQEQLIPGNPWAGYVFVIEDDLFSQMKRGASESNKFQKDVLFTDWSYLSRIKHLCQRLLEADLYDAAWAVATSRPTCPRTVKDPNICPQLKFNIQPHQHEFNWRELDPETSGFAHFVDQLSRQISHYYPDGPQPEPAPVGRRRR